MSIKVKRGLAINLPTLEEGELGFTTDSYEMYVGSDNGNILLNNGEILIRRNNGMLQYAQSNRKNQWFDICSLEEIRGDQGIQGIQGIQGVKGDKGDKGERGIQGEKGNPFTYADFTPDQLRALKGEKGDTGAKGERGLTGDKGDRGVGLNYAWSGTRLGVKRDTDAQYTYVDLRGADGRDGKQGERGERGIQGEKGDTPSITHLEKQVSDKSKELDTKFNTLTAKQQQDAEVVTARDGEVSLHARLERDLEKGKIHFVDIEGSDISTESEEGYLENVEIHGNTWQDVENLEDIRSVGTKVEGQELYEIPVLSCGKNLIPNKFRTGYPEQDSIATHSKWIMCTEYINVSGDTRYYVNSSTFNGVKRVAYFDKDRNFISQENKSSTFITPSNCRFIKLGATGSPEFTVTENHLLNPYIQLEEGTQATPYIPYQEHKLTILSPTPLEKVGDVADRIICKDGVWGVEKNIKTKTFTDDENWALSGQALYVNPKLDFDSSITNTNVVLNMIIGNEAVCREDYLYQGTRYGIGYKAINDTFRVRLEGVNSKEELNAYIKTKPIVLKYQTNQPTFIPLPHDQQVKLRTFTDRTNIHFETEIEPTIKAQVPKSLGATVNSHTTQIDNLNKELDRVKKLEESTVSTVTSDKAFTTVSETTQGYFEDVKIEGKTLVNLCEDIPFTYSAIYPNRDFKNWRMLKPSTKYTFALLGDFANARDVLISEGNLTEVMLPRGNYGQIFTFVTPSNINEFTKQQRIYVYKSLADLTETQVSGWKIIILEGDHTDKDITFFEGLKSVGQDSDEISVSSVNENLLMPFYTGNPVGFSNLSAISFNSDHSISYKATSWGQGVKVHVSGVSKGEKYLLLFDSNVNGCVRGYGGLETGGDMSCYANKVEFTAVSSGSAYIVFKNTIEVCDVSYTNARLVKKSSIDTSYKLHKQDKKEISYYNPNTQTWEKPVLREWDSIEKHSDGKYYYHKRSGEVVLNGSENWNDGTVQNNTIRYQCSANGIKLNANLICDKFNQIAGGTDTEGVSSHASNQVLQLTLTKDKSTVRTWLQANNVTVVYQLAQEEVYECTNLDLITCNGETNLIVNSGAIQPKITLKVLSNVSNVVKLLQEKVSVLENKFINGLKQVLAGDMMSLAHLLYPEDFELENDTPQVIPYIEEGDINE